MREDWRPVGPPAHVPDVRRDAVLRFVAEPPREPARAAIARHPACRQIILGKAADLGTIDRWFAAAAASTTAVGFAIGRSVFWDPSAAFLNGTATAERASADICANYLRLVAAWEARGDFAQR